MHTPGFGSIVAGHEPFLIHFCQCALHKGMAAVAHYKLEEES